MPNSFIIIKGQPKSLQIERIQKGVNGVYDVKFNSSPNTYHYRYTDVVWLNDAVWHDYQNLKVFIGGREQHNVTDVRSFQQGDKTHWRITFSNGYVHDYLHGDIQVIESCLGEAKAKNTFEYLKRMAQVNGLGKDEENGGILPALYEKIDFIDKTLAIAPYLDTAKHKVRKQRHGDLIFPFGCNGSQSKAVAAAFENQISVIQGPPGTGKTQTILNIIANILLQGMTVMVVSNNNSATTNVLEKLQKYGLDFLVAPLGRRENKEQFIQHQPVIPAELQTWQLELSGRLKKKREAASVLSQLREIFSLQEELANDKQELKAVLLEWEHYKVDNKVDDTDFMPKRSVKSKRLLKLWLQYLAYAEKDYIAPAGLWGKLKENIRWRWMNFIRKHLLGIKSPFDAKNILPTIQELQGMYYVVRLKELANNIDRIEERLKSADAKSLSNTLTDTSLSLLKDELYKKYHNSTRRIFADVKELRLYAEEVCKQYPVILSTTFSARTSIPDRIYDYIIMDEASQVSIETGALALTCAKNAVIVGDTMQLPNVVTDEDKIKLDGIFQEYKVAKGFDCGQYSFLQSVCAIILDVTQTLLREHYRCHPTIINFCNQRFYGGNLLIMTNDNGEQDVMQAIKTVPGHHCRGHYNQREIDVVKEEVLPNLKDGEDVGIVTPYNDQVRAFNQQLPSVGAATIHKYQGREKDTIIMSVVDDNITEFSDDSNLINVAVSRAKKRFCLVVSGNKQERKGNISELTDYIAYNNLAVTESKISSVFDYLYSHYTEERLSSLANHRQVSEYDSENLAYSLIEDILAEYPEFSHLGILCHTPLRNIIRDWSLLNEDEKRYISHFSTHLDFLIISRVTKKPILAVETDGFNYHNDATEQHQRDLKKDHILDLYGLPLLRLKTNESCERDKIVSSLNKAIGVGTDGTDYNKVGTKSV